MTQNLTELQAALMRAGKAARANRNEITRQRFATLQAEYREAKLAQHIADQIAKAPPFTADQRARLALILTPAPSSPIAA